MTDEHADKAKRKPPRPALASRILAVGASTAATIGLVGAMVARAPAPAPASARAGTVASALPNPLHIVVVVDRPRTAAPSSVSRAPSATRAPRILQQVVSAPAVTTTHAS